MFYTKEEKQQYHQWCPDNVLLEVRGKKVGDRIYWIIHVTEETNVDD